MYRHQTTRQAWLYTAYKLQPSVWANLPLAHPQPCVWLKTIRLGRFQQQIDDGTGVAPAGVSLNNQALRLWQYCHNRKNWLFSNSVAGADASAIITA